MCSTTYADATERLPVAAVALALLSIATCKGVRRARIVSLVGIAPQAVRLTTAIRI